MVSILVVRYLFMFRRGAICIGNAIVVSCALIQSAAAALPTRGECSAAFKDGQSLRRSGKLTDAVQRFEQCVASSCTAAMQKDCSTRLKEASDAKPRVTFLAKEKNGPAVSPLKLAVDGVAITNTADGLPLAMVNGPIEVSADPGEHLFEFSAVGYSRQTLKLVLKESTLVKESVLLERSAPMSEQVGVTSGAPTAGPAGDSARPPTSEPVTLASGDRMWMSSAPPGNDGVQIGIRVGHTFGLDGLLGDRMDFGLEGGWKFTRRDRASFYVGAGAKTMGNVGPNFLARCASQQCTHGSSEGAEINAQFVHSFTPAERFNPWVGGAAGYESAKASATRTASVSGVMDSVEAVAVGVDIRFLAGIDIRQNEYIGYGPVFDVAVLVPTSGRVTDQGNSSIAVSSWFTVGLRIVFLP